VRVILTFIIPYAFTAFFPSMYVLGKDKYLMYVWMTPVVALVFLSLALVVWRQGARAYESTGS